MNKSKNEIVKEESFNEDFCVHLECHLTRTFGNSANEKLKALWCDGVSMPLIDWHLSKKSVNDRRKIATKAWLGYNGNDYYDMVIKFGKYSLRRYAKGSDIRDCLPSDESTDWINVDFERKIIELQLK